VPTQRPGAIDTCLIILRDWSTGLTLDQKEIDNERGVIHEEWRLRTSASSRMFERNLPALYPGSKYGLRYPIGLMSVVDNFKYQALRDYYHKWYRPDNQCIIVVGDVDVDRTEAQIKKLWANATVPANAAQVTKLPVEDNEQAIYVFDKDKEMQNSTIGIFMKHDVFPDEMKTSQAYYIDSYMKTMIAMMLNQRFSEMKQKADCPFTSAGGYDGRFMLSSTKDAFTLNGSAKEGKEIETLKALYREAQRVRLYGFTPTEFERTKQEFLSQIESEYTNRDKTTNSQYGDELRDHFLKNEPIPSKEDEYKIMKQLIEMPALNYQVVNEYAKELISDNDKNLVVYIFAQDKAGKVDPTEEKMAQAIKEVRAEKIEPYVDNVKSEPLLDVTKLPKAGKIVKETENKKLGYKELTLSNGARVILKKTDFQANDVRFYAAAKGGSSLYGKADFDNLKLFNSVMSNSGLGNFSKQELTKALYGKQASASLSLGTYYQYVSGQSIPKDIETMMQLVYLKLTKVTKDQQAFDAMMKQYEEALKHKDLSPESVFGDSVSVTLYNHELRNAPLSVNTLKGVNYDRVLQIWKERYANPGQFTYYFVGNYDEAALRPLIEKYIGCLPKGKAENWKEVPGFVKGKVLNHFTFKSETPKAMSVEVWHQPTKYTVENAVLVDAAAQVLSMVYLKDIREDQGAAYSVGASGGLNRTADKTFAIIQAQCPMDPNKAEIAVKLLNEGIKNNSVKVDMDKLQKVKDFMLKQADISAKNNGHWINVLSEYITLGVDIQSDYKAAVEALTPEKIATFLKGLLASGNHVEVVMTPAK